MLAFCEGRKHASGDSGDIDLLLRRSLDGGKTWGKTQVVWDDGPNTCGNPCPVIDARTDTIWLLLTHNLGTDSEASDRGRDQQGNAHGLGDQEPGRRRDLERAGRDHQGREARRTGPGTPPGPGVGIQLRSGRLVVPCDNMVAGSKVQQSHVILSDDGGKTWRIGGVVGPQCDECQVVELADGRLMLNIRSYRGDHRRLVAISTRRRRDVLSSRRGRRTRRAGLPGEHPEPHDAPRRRPLLQPGQHEARADDRATQHRRGQDLARSSRSCTRARPPIRAWPMLKGGELACLYERGRKGAYETITLARFSRDWLTGSETASTRRRILYNLDGDSCMFLKKGSKGPGGDHDGRT